MFHEAQLSLLVWLETSSFVIPPAIGIPCLHTGFRTWVEFGFAAPGTEWGGISDLEVQVLRRERIDGRISMRNRHQPVLELLSPSKI